MIDLTGMISIPYLKKTTFTGSEKGTNFMIRKVSGEEGEPDKIQAITWPGPFIFSVTEEEKKTYHDFEFSEDGIHAAVAWLNEVTHSKELSLIHISEPTRRTPISYAVFCLKKKKKTKQ